MFSITLKINKTSNLFYLKILYNLISIKYCIKVIILNLKFQKEVIMYHEFKAIHKESDECLSNGICAISPIVSSINEIVLLYLKELSFYLSNLRSYGIVNQQIKDVIIDAIFNIVTNSEYDQKEFSILISTLYDYIYQSKALYEKYCYENNLDIQVSKNYFKYSKSFNLSDAIRKGEKYFLKKSNTFSSKQKELYDILLFLAKSITIKIVEIERLGEAYEEAYWAVLELLNTMSIEGFTEENVKKKIEEVIEVYYEVMNMVYSVQKKLYGEIERTEVSFSTEQGKAILVSGSDFKKLELVLKAVENTDINVYTHGLEMIMAHAFPKFKSNPRLKGHFGSGMESTLVDFAAFPGAILMTRGTLQRVEYLYRGRLFTLDPIAPQGVVKLKIDNFQPLINSALDARGFSKVIHNSPVMVGFDESEVNKKIGDIINKVLTGEIKHLYIIGLIYALHSHRDYFEKFFMLLPSDCYAISICCPVNTHNIFHLEAFNDYSYLYKILKEIKRKVPLENINITTFLTKCDKHTISNLLYLKHAGVKNVYMCKCPTTLLSPGLMQTFCDVFGIKEISDPKQDLDDTLKQ